MTLDWTACRTAARSAELKMPPRLIVITCAPLRRAWSIACATGLWSNTATVSMAADRHQLGQRRRPAHAAAFRTRDHAAGTGAVTWVAAGLHLIDRLGTAFHEIRRTRIVVAVGRQFDMLGHDAGVRLEDENVLALGRLAFLRRVDPRFDHLGFRDRPVRIVRAGTVPDPTPEREIGAFGRSRRRAICVAFVVVRCRDPARPSPRTKTPRMALASLEQIGPVGARNPFDDQ